MNVLWRCQTPLRTRFSRRSSTPTLAEIFATPRNCLELERANVPGSPRRPLLSRATSTCVKSKSVKSYKSYAAVPSRPSSSSPNSRCDTGALPPGVLPPLSFPPLASAPSPPMPISAATADAACDTTHRAEGGSQRVEALSLTQRTHTRKRLQRAQDDAQGFGGAQRLRSHGTAARSAMGVSERPHAVVQRVSTCGARGATFPYQGAEGTCSLQAPRAGSCPTPRDRVRIS